MSSPELRRARDESKILEIKIISGSDISHSDVACKMDVYAVVSITGDNIEKKQGAKTPIDFNGGSNPTWNHTIKFSLDEEEARLNLKVKLFSYWLDGENDLYLGEVNVSVQDTPLANGGDGDNKPKLATYSVKTIERSKGTLSLSYRFKPESTVHDSAQEQASLAQPVMYSPPQIKKLTLKLVIKSAKDIENQNIRSGMKVFASIIIREGKSTITNTIINTPLAHCIYRNPKWDYEFKLSLDEKSVQEGRLTLVVKLIAVRSFRGDKEIGEVKVQVKELFELNPPSSNVDDENGMSLMTRDVKVPDGREGTLSFTYKFLVEPFIHEGEQSSNVQQPQYSPKQESIGAVLGISPAIAGIAMGGFLMD